MAMTSTKPKVVTPAATGQPSERICRHTATVTESPMAVASQEMVLGFTGTMETPNTAAIIKGPRILSH